MKRKVLLLLSAFGLMTQFSYADIYSTRKIEKQFIKVSKSSQDDKLTFQLCLKDNPQNCVRTLGNHAYSIKKLKAAKQKLLASSIGLGVVEIASLAALPLLGGAAGSLAAGEAYLLAVPAGPAYSAAFAGSVAGFGAGLATHFMVIAKKLNPKEKFDASRLIRNQILSDDNIYIKGSIAEYADNFEEVLLNIRN